MAKKRPKVVKAAAQMWPPIVFDFKGKFTVKKCLREPGVYVLFRDDEPYYVGKTSKQLFWRIHHHATKPMARYYHFWNYFSAFVVLNPRHRDEVEGVLIASMPTANSATSKIKKIYLPQNVTELMRRMRTGAAKFDE